MTHFHPSAVLFDLDGTLLDTIEDLAEAVNHMLADLKRPQRTLTEIHSFVGKGMAHLVQRCLNEHAPEPATSEQITTAITLFRKHYTSINGKSTRLYPGIIETLNRLHKQAIKLAVVTNKADAFTHTLLEKMGIDRYFDTVVCGDTLPTRKPDPAMLEHTCQLLQIEPQQAVMVGDSNNDAQAARAAGIPVLLVRYGYSEGQPVDTIECDGLVSGALELFDHIRLS